MGLFDGWFGLESIFGGQYRAKLSGGAQPPSSSDPAPAPLNMTPQTALQLGAVWACVRLLSETIGTLPLGVYRKDGKGRRQEYSQHGLYALLHDAPNADQSAAEFWEAVVASLCLWGNAYAEKPRNGADDLAALNFLRPDWMGVGRDAQGARVYTYNNPRKATVTYHEDELFHVRGFGLGHDIGLPPISYARLSLGSAMTANQAASTAIESGVRGSGFLIVPGKPTPEQKKGLKETFLDPITGAGNTAKAGVLEQGMDWKSITGLPPEDLQLLETRAFHVEEICRWFRVPPFMVGHSEKSTSWGTGLEQQTIGFLTYALRPYLTRIEQAVKQQLLQPAERASVYAEFNLEGLMRADSAGRAALYSTLAQNGVYTRNEIRARENLPPADGGDVLTVQSNLIPLDKLGETPPPPVPPPNMLPASDKPPEGEGSPPAAAAA